MAIPEVAISHCGPECECKTIMTHPKWCMCGDCISDLDAPTQTPEYNELSESTRKVLEYHKAYVEGHEPPNTDPRCICGNCNWCKGQTERGGGGFGSTGGYTKSGENFCKTPEELKVSIEEGLKYDTGKIRTDLLPVYPLLQVAMVLTFGAIKYGDRNWEQGIAFGRMYGAALRHLFAWWNGEDLDPESGLHHLAHAACTILMALQYTLANREYDDRPEQVISPN